MTAGHRGPCHIALRKPRHSPLRVTSPPAHAHELVHKSVQNCVSRPWFCADFSYGLSVELGYARVSTTRQDLERQIDALQGMTRSSLYRYLPPRPPVPLTAVEQAEQAKQVELARAAAAAVTERVVVGAA